MEEQNKQLLDEAYDQLVKISLNQVPVKGLDKLIHPEIMGWGTTIAEEVHDQKGFINFVQNQENEAKKYGIEFNFERTKVHEFYSPNKEMALFIEKIKANYNADEIENQFTFRFTAVMALVEEQWELVHWHGSIPSDIGEDAWHLNEWKAEKEKLEKKVADQTADLQKKNRELEIEAASERVRAHAMGMQTTEDLDNVIQVLNVELSKLDLEGQNSAYIWIRKDEDHFNIWNLEHVEQSKDNSIHSETINFNDFELFKRQLKDWESNPNFFITHSSNKELYEFMEDFRKFEKYIEFADIYQNELDQGNITEVWATSAGFGPGFIGCDFLQEPNDWVKKILQKMASAFGMAYQRFLDLQKAEAQAKESRIEAALERVRSRTMAMQNSDELADVGLVLFQQIEKAIGFEPESSWISLINPDENTLEIWVTHEDKYIEPKIVSAHDHKNFEQEIAAWNSGEKSIQITLPKEDFIQAVKLNFGMEVSDKKEYSDFHVLNVRHDYGFLGVGSWNLISDENIKIYKRFAKVFQQTYTRFLDLKKSEQQAYESKVEASLERVRSMAAAMNHSDDLMQIAEEMFKEMEILKINPLRYGIAMIDSEKIEAELWASTVNDGHYLDMLGVIPLEWHPMLLKAYNAWSDQHEELIYKLEGKELSDYYKRIGPVNPDIPNLKSLQNPDTKEVQYCNFFPFNYGILYAFTDGKPGEEGRSILTRFSSVFEQAYIRYHDLQKSELQANQIREERDRLEIALKELESTKDQLVQQEKLASLGQLTAGIAHEIKNPLNFVNNFSELSVELIDEAREELSSISKGISSVDQEKIEEANEILNDIEANLKTINKHGTRADNIVKSMLEHSRGGTGELQPTNLNALLKEFATLSFHGMRASKTPINVDLDFQLDESITDVSLISEDFSRVIVNLANNAFDALREKLIVKGETFSPKLIVRTIKDDRTVRVEIEDNGPGIPDDIKDKILQPFFTTKKGTEGTGLGLSITNDIIKAHGGKLTIESEVGKGSLLAIQLSSN